MTILAIDPGPESSAFVTYGSTGLRTFGEDPNKGLLNYIVACRQLFDHCVIEKVVSYGMGVGAEVFETVYWSGIFAHAFGIDHVDRLPRLEVKLHICHDSKAKDSNIRVALMDRFGGPQSARKGGPLYKVGQHERAALALAITWWDRHRMDTRENLAVLEALKA